MKSKTKQIKAAQALQAQPRVRPIYRTVITIFPEVPTAPSYTLESSKNQGETWNFQFSTTDSESYANGIRSAGYKITEVVTNQELPL